MTGVLSLFLHQEVLFLFGSHKKGRNFIKKDNCFINILEKVIASYEIFCSFWWWEPQFDAALGGCCRDPICGEVPSISPRLPPSNLIKFLVKDCIIQDIVNDRQILILWFYVGKYLVGVDIFFFLTRYKREVHQLCAATNCMSKKYGTVLMESR